MASPSSNKTRTLPILIAMVVSLFGVLPMYTFSSAALDIEGDARKAAVLIGTVIPVFFIAASISSLLVARWLRPSHVRIAVGGALLASAIASSLIAFRPDDLPTVVVAMIIAALSNTLAQSSANVLIMAAAPVLWRATALSGKQAAVPLASLLAGASFPIVILTLGPGWTFVGLAVLAVLSIALVFGVSYATVASRPSRSHIPGPAVTKWRLLLLFCAAFFGTAPGNGAAVFAVPSEVAAGASVELAGWVLVIGSLGGIVGRLVLGVAADRNIIGDRAMVVIAALLFVASAAYLALGLELSTLFRVLIMLVAFVAGWGWNGLFIHEALRHYPDAGYQISGTLQGGVYFGAAILPIGFAGLVSYGSYSLAWAVTAAFAAVGGILMVALHLKWKPELISHDSLASGSVPSRTQRSAAGERTNRTTKP